MLQQAYIEKSLLLFPAIVAHFPVEWHKREVAWRKNDKILHDGRGIEKCHFVSDILFLNDPWGIFYLASKWTPSAKKIQQEKLNKVTFNTLSSRLCIFLNYIFFFQLCFFWESLCFNKYEKVIKLTLINIEFASESRSSLSYVLQKWVSLKILQHSQ